MPRARRVCHGCQAFLGLGIATLAVTACRSTWSVPRAFTGPQQSLMKCIQQAKASSCELLHLSYGSQHRSVVLRQAGPEEVLAGVSGAFGGEEAARAAVVALGPEATAAVAMAAGLAAFVSIAGSTEERKAVRMEERKKAATKVLAAAMADGRANLLAVAVREATSAGCDASVLEPAKEALAKAQQTTPSERAPHSEGEPSNLEAGLSLLKGLRDQEMILEQLWEAVARSPAPEDVKKAYFRGMGVEMPEVEEESSGVVFDDPTEELVAAIRAARAGGISGPELYGAEGVLETCKGGSVFFF